MNEKNIIVKGIEQVATGTNSKGQWTLYKITDNEEIEYKSFQALNLNTPYRISYTEEPKKPFVATKGEMAGKTITPKGVDRFIKSAQISETPPVQTPKVSVQYLIAKAIKEHEEKYHQEIRVEPEEITGLPF